MLPPGWVHNASNSVTEHMLSVTDYRDFVFGAVGLEPKSLRGNQTK